LSIYHGSSCKVSAQIQLWTCIKNMISRTIYNHPKGQLSWETLRWSYDSQLLGTIDYGQNKDEHDLLWWEWNFMLMEWVVWSLDKETQERSWPHKERACVTLWAIGTISSSGHKGNEFLSTHPILRWKASRFI
jgi:hypothetical protein